MRLQTTSPHSDKYTFLVWILALLMLTGCFEKTEKVELASVINSSNTEIRKVFATKKINLHNLSQYTKVSAKVSGNAKAEDVIAANSHLMILADNECLQNAAAGTLSAQTADNGEKTSLPLQAYTYLPKEDISLSELTAKAEADPCLIGLAENGEMKASYVPNDPSFPVSDHLVQIEAAKSWDWFLKSKKGINKDVVVAVIDSGINHAHQDLMANMWKNANGQYGFDFINGDTDPMDDNGHGSHVAGIIGAVMDNQNGSSGVLGTKIKLMGVKVLNSSGSGSYTAIVNGIMFAINNKADIINMSLGGAAPSAALEAALKDAANAGIFTAVAAGNENVSLNTTPSYPANYGAGINGMMTVGSLDSKTGLRSSFSNFSTNLVEIFAPGSESATVGIFSTYLGANGFNRLRGTSMATPVVAGAAALVIGLLKTNNVTYTAAMIETLLFDGSTKNNNLVNFGKDGRNTQLFNLVVHVANQVANADPRELKFTKQPAPVEIKVNTAVNLEVTAEAFPTITYQWYKDGQKINGATSAKLTLASVGPGDLGEYQMEIDNSFKKMMSDKAKVNVLFPPQLSQAIVKEQTGQHGSKFTLSVSFISNPPPTFQWYRDGQPIAGATNSALEFTTLNWPDRGKYHVVITNNEGTLTTEPLTLKLDPISRYPSLQGSDAGMNYE